MSTFGSARLLNRGIRIFFSEFVRVSLRRPSQAVFFARTVLWQGRTAFTGAGISVASGIPPFRGPGRLWSQYDPRMLELDYFLSHPERSWPILREIFYNHFGKARPSRAHEALAEWKRDGWRRERAARGVPSGAAPSAPDARGYLKALITQNIDSVQ